MNCRLAYQAMCDVELQLLLKKMRRGQLLEYRGRQGNPCAPITPASMGIT